MRGYVNVSQLLGLTLFLLSSEIGDLGVDGLKLATVADPEGVQGVPLNPRTFPPFFKYPKKMK